MNEIFINSQLYGTFDFSKIKDDDYISLFEECISQKRAEIDLIINNQSEPTFENTIKALEFSGERLDLVSGLFFNLLHCNSNDKIISVSEYVIPKLTELSSDIIFNDRLFKRISYVYDNADKYDMDEEDLRLLKNCYDGFIESGANLSDDKKQRLRDISIQMSNESLVYSNNILKEQNVFKLYIDEYDKVKGIPDIVLEIAKSKAKEHGHESGWLFDLSSPSYVPFMQYCSDRESRRIMYFEKATLCSKNNEFDNKDVVRNIVNLRLEEAQILGYEDFSAFALKNRMAKDKKTVYELLDKLLDAYKPKAIEEVGCISEFAKSHGVDYKLEPWDWSYWAEKYKKRYYDIDDETLRPYFELSSVNKAIFSLANKLYGISFTERYDIDVYHKDVKVFEVTDNDGAYIGLLYIDFFPRTSKQNGAWMNNFQDQYIDKYGKDHRPHVVLVMNFTPPSEGTPSLLTLSEVSTFLHEFGHALHGLLSKCKYSSISGTSVARDFVELPSQLMENWLREPLWLKSFAKHYKTGKSIDDNIMEKLKKAENFLVGYSGCRQLSFGYLDMAWHTITTKLDNDFSVYDFENNAWEKALIFSNKNMNCVMSTSFSHIFSGGYSSGYYSYKWSEVLDADVYEEFISGGIYNRNTAERFRNIILSSGDKRDAMDLFVEFKGRKPSIDALLVRDGIKTK